MTVKEFADKHSLKVLSLPCPEREINGGYAGDLLSWVMGRAKSDSAWITIMSNANIIAVATLSDVACIILAEGVALDQGVLALAEDKEINILSSELDTYNISALIFNDLV